MGFLFQNYALWPHMTVFQNIAFGLENLKWGKKEIKERVRELQAVLHIENLENQYPNELSGGLRTQFEPFNAVTLDEREVVVGIRPEYIHIERDGPMEGTVFSTLPSGMETTVKMYVNGISLTSLVFGDVDFPVDKKVRFSFHKAAMLFDRESGRAIARGKLIL